MAVCRIGRETIEYDENSEQWRPVQVTERPEHLGACVPAVMMTIELITAEMQPRPCMWCAWRNEDSLYGALYLINGKGCCEVHPERAVREETVALAARHVIRDAARTINRP